MFENERIGFGFGDLCHGEVACGVEYDSRGRAASHQSFGKNESAAVGQLHVEQDDVWIESLGIGDRGRATVRLANNEQVRNGF